MPASTGQGASTVNFVQTYVDTGLVEVASGNGETVDNCNGSYTVSYRVRADRFRARTA